MKAVAITGATGFIGKALAKRLLSSGYKVYAVVRSTEGVSDITGEDLIPVKCDFAHYDQLAAMLPEKIDWFIHLAWDGVSGKKSSDIEIQMRNVEAAVIAMKQAETIRAKKFVFLGSSYQYRMEPVTLYGKTVYLKKNIYGAAKQACMKLLQANSFLDGIGMDFNCVLFTNVFGVGDGSNRSTNVLIRQLLRGEDLNLIQGDHLHDWTYIDDAVDGLLAVLEKGLSGKSYYIGNRKLRTFKNIVIELRDILAPNARLYFGSYDDDSYIDYGEIDLDELYHDTGFECTANFRESILKTAEWIDQQQKKGAP